MDGWCDPVGPEQPGDVIGTQFRASVLSKIKLGRVGRVGDLMGGIIFFASNAAALMTGSSLVVDGGWTAD